MALAMRHSSPWARRVHRMTAAITVIVQVMLLFAPLTEIRDARAASQERAPAVHGVSGAVSAPTRPVPVHDESTCPACIARSLHARLETLVPLPVLAVEERTPPSVASVIPAHTDPPTSHLSRAPPVTG